MGIEAFRYDGKRALVVGGATGMGAAAAQIVRDLGGEVVVMDYADVSFPVAKSIKVDLRNQADVDTPLDEVGGPVHALFSCAGVADGTEGIMKINFIAHRHIIDRLIDGGKMPRARPSASSRRSPVSVGRRTSRRWATSSARPTTRAARSGSRRRGHRQLQLQQAGDQRLRRA